MLLRLDQDERNPYLALARIAWSNGEDGEAIARHLAEAFAAIARDGLGEDADVGAELVRLAPPSASPPAPPDTST